MSEALDRGILGLGQLIKRVDVVQLIRSIGWESHVPLVVALRGETFGDVKARYPERGRMIVFIYDPLAQDYTVAGIDDEGMDEEHRELREEAFGQLPVETMYQHVRGNEKAFDGLTVKSSRVLQLN